MSVKNVRKEGDHLIRVRIIKIIGTFLKELPKHKKCIKFLGRIEIETVYYFSFKISYSWL